MQRSALLSAFIVLFLSVPAFADSWLPFQDRRVVSPTGKTYVVIERVEGGISFELCRRAEGKPPMTDATAPDRFGLREGTGGSIDRDSGDELIGTGRVDQMPLRVRVLDEPAGFVLFEKYGNVGHGDALIFVTGREGVRFRRKLDELFDAATLSGFQRSVSSIWWHAGIAVDEDAGSILVVANGDRLRQVGLREGKVAEPEKEVLLRGFRRGSSSERELCLEAAARMKPEGLHGEALAVAKDEGEATALRLRAAVAVRAAGGEEDFARLFVESIEIGSGGANRSYAVEHLGDVAGAEAIPTLRRLMRGKADNEVWSQAQQAFASLGEKAVPTLIEMLLEEAESSDYRGGAAHALKKIGSPASVDALLQATATAPDYVANAALNAAIEIGASDLDERLTEILAAGSTQDGRIALHFTEHPRAQAKEALTKALGRAKAGSNEDRWIRAALGALEAK
jgi:HEAT repeats